MGQREYAALAVPADGNRTIAFTPQPVLGVQTVLQQGRKPEADIVAVPPVPRQVQGRRGQARLTQGGVMETYREFVRLTSKPLDMPKKVTVDVTDMNINDTVGVADLKLPENVKAVFDQNFALVSVLTKTDDAPEGEGEEAAADTAAAAE